MMRQQQTPNTPAVKAHVFVIQNDREDEEDSIQVVLASQDHALISAEKMGLGENGTIRAQNMMGRMFDIEPQFDPKYQEEVRDALERTQKFTLIHRDEDREMTLGEDLDKVPGVILSDSEDSVEAYLSNETTSQPPPKILEKAELTARLEKALTYGATNQGHEMAETLGLKGTEGYQIFAVNEQERLARETQMAPDGEGVDSDMEPKQEEDTPAPSMAPKMVPDMGPGGDNKRKRR